MSCGIASLGLYGSACAVSARRPRLNPDIQPLPYRQGKVKSPVICADECIQRQSKRKIGSIYLNYMPRYAQMNEQYIPAKTSSE